MKHNRTINFDVYKGISSLIYNSTTKTTQSKFNHSLINIVISSKRIEKEKLIFLTHFETSDLSFKPALSGLYDENEFKASESHFISS